MALSRHTLWMVSAMSLFIAPHVLADSDADVPLIFQTNPQTIVAVRSRARSNEPAIAPALEHLKAEADKALKEGPYSVTQKKVPSLTGDAHDYISLAPYFWPNPDTKDGLPYVRHDGRRNPEIREYDAGRFGSMSGRAHTLALAYYLTGNEAYAERAALLLRTWFLDPATTMNPNLDHAQLVKGTNDGRGTGIIESARLLGVVDAVGLLHGSKAWTPDDQKGMQAWFSQYLTWMRQSKNGKAEAAAKNNHGTWYDVQAVTFALFVSDESTARAIAEEAKTKRITSQVQPDGSLPLELTRTNSLGYSTFDVKAFTQLADLGARVGVDLWSFKTQDGRSICASIDYLLPYVLNEKKWEHEQISKFDSAGFVEPLQRAFAATHDVKYKKAIEKLKGDGDSAALEDLRFPTQ
jgi:hypothetical protein